MIKGGVKHVVCLTVSMYTCQKEKKEKREWVGDEGKERG
jgi:hypothetical protein